MELSPLVKQLIEHEGLRLKPYRCSAGKLTIGIGRNLDDRGITEKEAMLLLRNDILECVKDLRTIFPRFERIAETRRNVLIDMRFNLGPKRFRGFKKMIAAVKARDFEEAARQMADSQWYWQVGDRAKTLIEMMLQ